MYILQMIFIGLVNGGIYALISIGLALLFGVLRLINIAHGEFLTIGAYSALILMIILNPFVIIPIVICVGFLFGFGIDRSLLSILRRAGRWQSEASTVLTLGISTLLANLMLILAGPHYRSGVPIISGTILLFNMAFAGQRLLIAGICLLVVGLLFWFLKFTKPGKAIRALSQDPVAAQTLGINQEKTFSMTLGLVGSLAAVAGMLVSSVFYVHPYMGLPFLMKGFVISVLGGLGSVGGALVGSYILGISEAMGVMIVGSQYRDAIGLLMMVAILMLRPRGIFGAKENIRL